MLWCSDCLDCGGLSAAVFVGTITHDRTPWTQRLSLARKLWIDAVACQPLSFSWLCCCYRSITAPLWCCSRAHQLYCTNPTDDMFLPWPCATPLYHVVCAVQFLATARRNSHVCCNLTAGPSPCEAQGIAAAANPPWTCNGWNQNGNILTPFDPHGLYTKSGIFSHFCVGWCCTFGRIYLTGRCHSSPNQVRSSRKGTFPPFF